MGAFVLAAFLVMPKDQLSAAEAASSIPTRAQTYKGPLSARWRLLGSLKDGSSMILGEPLNCKVRPKVAPLQEAW